MLYLTLLLYGNIFLTINAPIEATAGFSVLFGSPGKSKMVEIV